MTTAIPQASAGWSLPRLVDELARAGWGVLHGRRGGAARSILRALAQTLPDRSASGLVTANQIADMAGLSSRWARSTLAVFEAAGIITWTRGGILDGQPQPSVIRVSKRAIAALVNDARRSAALRLRGRAASFARRLAEELRHRTIIRRSKQPVTRATRRVHAELKTSPLPLRGEETGREARPGPRPITGSMLSPAYQPPPAPTTEPRGAGRLRAALRKACHV